MSPGRNDQQLLHLLFQESVARNPGALAVATPHHCLTYGELDTISNRVAEQVRSSGLGNGDLAAIAMHKGWEQIAAVLGVLKAGSAYVPIAPDLPAARFRSLFEQAGCRLALRQLGMGTALAIPSGVETVAVGHGMAGTCAAPITSTTRPDDLAYVLFTSGSTGVPKGAMLEHAGVANTVCDLNRRFGVGPSDRYLGLSSLSFDMSVYDMFGAFAAGGALVLPGPEQLRDPGAWVDLIRRYDVTVWNSVPGLLAMLVSWMEDTGCGGDGSLRLAFLGGDWIPLDLPDRARRFFDGLKIVNIGGATEASICSSFYVVDRVDPSWTNVPYGKALTGQYWRILRPDLEECEVGEVGELYIGGVGVARGYLGDEARTARSFIEHPQTLERLYRTGDLGRWMDDGNIDFLGRIDHQVKVLGNRVELGEIEAQSRGYPGVRQAVAVAIGQDIHLDRIILFVTTREPGASEADLKGYLRDRLPAYMVPDRCEFLDSLPLSGNGKVDRARLTEQARVLATAAGPGDAPATDTEQRLAGLWREVIGVELVGRDVSVFNLGVSSLAATALAGRIRRAFGVEVPAGFAFSYPTIAAMAAALGTFQSADPHPAEPPSASGAALTFGQEQLWYFEHVAGAGSAYQFQASIRFHGDLRVDLLQRALTQVVARHETLRTTYVDQGGTLQPVVHLPYDVELVVEDLRYLPADVRDQSLRDAIARELARGFALSHLPLARWRLFRTGDLEWTLTEVEHHVVHDGWSVALLWREVETMYRSWLQGQTPVLSELPQQLGDYAKLQRRSYLERKDELLEHWRNRLSGAPLLDLPIARRRPAKQTYAGAVRRVPLDAELYEQLRWFARDQGCSLYVVMLTAFKILLHRYSAEPDLCVGSWVANRVHPEAQHLIGMLVNMVVMRDRLGSDATVREFLTSVRETAVTAFDHQEAPFQEVVRAVDPLRDPSRNPLAQVCFSFHDSPVPEFDWPGVKGTFVEEHNGSAKFDINVVVVPHAEQRGVARPRAGVDELILVWEYNTDLFDGIDMDRMLEHYRQVLIMMIADPDALAWQVDFRTATEKELASREWGLRAHYPESTIDGLVTAQAQRTPDAPAVSCGTAALSYAELAARTSVLAAGLRAAGVSKGDRVAVCLMRSTDLVASLLAVMAAGAAYVPVDPAHPTARNRLIIEASGARVLLTDGAPLSLGTDRARTFTLNELEDLSGAPDSAPEAVAGPDNLMYVLFTSGSTGRPKGVAVTHRSVANILWDMRNRLELGRDDLVAAVTTVSFDISVLELFAALAVGGRVDVVPEEVSRRPAALRAHLDNVGATVLQGTPTMWRLLLEAGLTRRAGRFVALCGGEQCAPDLAAAIAAVASDAWNVYGPTETTIWSTAHRLGAADGAAGAVPIGLPIANTRCLVLSAHGVPQPTAVPGELYIAGDGVAAYHDDEALSARSFTTLSVLAPEGGRAFATGDVVRWNQAGELEFLGRRDRQVKLRGHRIELGEVEAVLCACPSVRNAAVVVELGERDAEPRLVAYVETDVTDATLIRQHLRTHLPTYMEPERISRVDALPTTSSGKVDRARLSSVVATTLTAHPSKPEPSATEPIAGDAGGATLDLLAKVFAEVLGVERVDPDDDFFELGGHSLLALRLAHRVREQFDAEIGLELILDHGSVNGLAKVLSHGDPAGQ